MTDAADERAALNASGWCPLGLIDRRSAGAIPPGMAHETGLGPR